MIQQTRFTNYVGVAPGTTTMYIPDPTVSDMRGHTGLGLIQAGAYSHTGDVGRVYRNGIPYGIPTQEPQLGFIPGMASGGWNRSLSGSTFVESRQVPNDAEMSRVYGYTPVAAGWLYADKLAGDEDTGEKSLAERSHKARMVGNFLIALSTAVTIGTFLYERAAIRSCRK